MRMTFYGFLLFLSLETSAVASITQPVCETTDDGKVFLVSEYKASNEQAQKMVLEVGQENWREPTQARTKCEHLKESYTLFSGEKWLPKICVCTYRSIQDRVIVIKDSRGRELEFYAHNQLSYRDVTDINPLFHVSNDHDADCKDAPDPMCGF